MVAGDDARVARGPNILSSAEPTEHYLCEPHTHRLKWARLMRLTV